MASVDWSPTTLCGTGNTNATACYVYNALGQRVQATYGGNSYHDIVEWVFDPSGNELSECETGFGAGNGQCWYNSWVRLGGRSIADYMPTNVTAFNHPDNLDSTTFVTGQDGIPRTDTHYYPFGQTWLSGGAGTWDVHFAGMQFPETNFSPWLMPTPNRKYYPSLGRWLSPDPENAGANEGDPQTWNAYSYVGNNPTSRTDPEGTNYTLCGVNGKDCQDLTDAQYDAWRRQNPDVHASPSGDLTVTDANGHSVKIGTESYYDEHALDSLVLAGRMAGPSVNLLGAGLAGFLFFAGPGILEASYEVPMALGLVGTPVIGKMADLGGNLAPGERELALPNQGSESANWAQNARRIKQEMAEGRPIKDATALKYGNDPKAMNTGFLARERALLRENGWWYNNGYWYPPVLE